MSLQSLNRQIRIVWVALSMLVLCSGLALAQNESGQILGKVTDGSGAAISGANVTVRAVQMGVERYVTTESDGFFLVTSLQPGLYEVAVQSSGFAPTIKRVEVTVGARRRLELQMSVTPPPTERPAVEGSGGVDVNSQDPQLSDPISGRQFRELPLVTRDPNDLISLSANLTPMNNPATASGQRDPAYAIDGQRPTANNVQVDGGENVVNYTTALGQRIPLEGVQEMQVITNGFRPEFGRVGGGVINVATRHGSNDFHGALYDFHRNSELASNSFENDALGIPQGHMVANQFGVAVGGRIFPDRFYFFVNGEGNLVRSRENRTALVPTPGLLAASSPATAAFFSGFPLAAPINGRVFTVGDVLAMTGGAAAPGNAFAALPAGLPAFGQVIYNVPTDAGAGAPQDTVMMVSRLDYTWSDKTHIYGRYSYEYRDLFQGGFTSSPYAGFNTGARERNHGALINLATNVTSAWVMNAKGSYNRINFMQNGGSLFPVPRLSMTAYPQTSLGGFLTALPGDQPFDPTWNSLFTGPVNLVQGALDFSGPWRRQQFRFGANYFYTQDNRSVGSYQNGLYTLGPTALAALNNLVLGQVSTFQAAVNPQGALPGGAIALPVSQPDFNRSLSAHDFSLYFSHIWRAHPRVNVNWGLRYDYFDTPRSRNGLNYTNFFLSPDPNPFIGVANGQLATAGAAGINGTLYERDWNNVAPRVGLAIDLLGDGKTSLRLGYGITYDRTFNLVSNFYQQSPGFAIASLTAGTGGIGTVPLSASPFGPLGGGAGAAVLPPTTLRAIDQDFETPKVHFWNASLEREVLRNTLVSLQYAGAAGRDLANLYNVNLPGSAAAFLGSADPTARLNPAFGPIYLLNNDGRSNYHAFIAEIANSSWRTLGLTMTARYRWARAMDNVATWQGNNFGTFDGSLSTGLLAPFDPGFNYGPSDFDVRHRFIGSFSWEVPFEKIGDRYFGGTGSRIARNAFGGWQLSGILNVQSGTPFSVFNCAGALTAETPCPRAAMGTTASQTGFDDSQPDPTLPNRFIYLNRADFVTTGVVPGTAVSAFPATTIGRNFFYGPHSWNVDLGVSKRFRFTEDTSLQFRGEFFNVFNHANLYVPNGVDISTTGYVPAYKQGRRTIQLAVKLLF